ncbi:hypothetical protein D3C80_488220 [compost metagenome]
MLHWQQPTARLSTLEDQVCPSYMPSLPMFEAGGLTLLKRLTMIIEDGRIRHVFYPVDPPDKNADAVIVWLKTNYHSKAHG